MFHIKIKTTAGNSLIALLGGMMFEQRLILNEQPPKNLLIVSQIITSLWEEEI